MLVLDSCALLHAKQLGAPLELIARVVLTLGLPAGAPPRLLGEQAAMTLSATLEQLEVQPCKVLSRDARQAVNRASRRRLGGSRVRIPGSADQKAVTLAWKQEGALLTHDDAAAEMAWALGVPCADILDLLVYGADREVFEHEEVEEALDGLLHREPPFPWQPLEWRRERGEEGVLELVRRRERESLQRVLEGMEGDKGD